MEQDFISKKQEVTRAFDNYINQEISREEFISTISKYLQDPILSQVELFKKTIEEIIQYCDELSLKDIKQRKLMLESYIY